MRFGGEVVVRLECWKLFCNVCFCGDFFFFEFLEVWLDVGRSWVVLDWIELDWGLV